MSINVVTTLHEDGYRLYGQKFIRTWSLYFPNNWNITYYAEKHQTNFDSRVKVVDFDAVCPQWIDFYNFVKEQTANLKDKKKINRFKKALRWSFKMFTLLHALENSNTRYVIWLDADVFAKRSPPANWIEKTLGSACIAGQLEFVKNFPHVETGLLIIDTKHPDIDKLINWIKAGYIDKKILDEPKPWDGAWIGKLFMSETVSCKRIKMMFLDKDNGRVAKAFSDESLYWLTHRVGDNKFNSDYSGRSGRTKNSELI